MTATYETDGIPRTQGERKHKAKALQAALDYAFPEKAWDGTTTSLDVCDRCFAVIPNRLSDRHKAWHGET